MTFPKALMPVDTPAAPLAVLPKGACDAHVHMVAGDDFPLWDGRVEDPAGGELDDWIARFRHHLDVLGLDRSVIVHSILYGADNSVTIAAVKALGAVARGIGLVTDQATEAELDALVEANIVGVRLNYVHGGVLSWEGVKRLAPMLSERGMHVQMLMNAHKHMADLANDLRALPVPVVFDHIGWPDLTAGPSEPGFETLCALLSEGHVHVKLSGVYRLCDAPYIAADPAVQALVAANPEHCLWGSDWPHLMLADAKHPDAGILLNAFLRAVPSDAHRQMILVDAPARLYGF